MSAHTSKAQARLEAKLARLRADAQKGDEFAAHVLALAARLDVRLGEGQPPNAATPGDEQLPLGDEGEKP